MQNKAWKLKYEKFEKEKVTEYKRDLTERDNEIQVLKDMVKAAQLQLKAKERDSLRFKQRSI